MISNIVVVIAGVGSGSVVGRRNVAAAAHWSGVWIWTATWNWS